MQYFKSYIIFIILASLKLIKCQNTNSTGLINVFTEQNFTMNEILNFDIVKCNGERDSTSCPKYSGGCQYFVNIEKFSDRHNYYCKYNFVCLSEKNCYFFISDYNSVVSEGVKKEYNTYMEKFGKKKTKILETCNIETKNNKNDCVTPTCKINDDCFSNNCIGGICYTQKSKPIYICGIRDDDSPELISCKLNIQEECLSNKDCNSSICFNNVCINKQSKYQLFENDDIYDEIIRGREDDNEDDERNTLEFTLSILILIISFFLVVIISIVIAFMICWHPNSDGYRSLNSRHMRSTGSETIYVLNENKELIKTKLKMLDSTHSSNYSHATNLNREKRRVYRVLI